MPKEGTTSQETFLSDSYNVRSEKDFVFNFYLLNKWRNEEIIGKLGPHVGIS